MSIGSLIYYIKSVRFLPHLLCIWNSPIRKMLDYERDRWLEANRINASGIKGYITLLMAFPEYRSLLYLRTHKNFLRHFAAGQTNLYFHTPSENIGKGLVIWHGYSTVINAKEVGENVQIWHNVTIGKKTTGQIDDRPIIGNGVSICTGSVVIGDIHIADNVIIGAGTVVVDTINKAGSKVIGCKGIVK